YVPACAAAVSAPSLAALVPVTVSVLACSEAAPSESAASGVASAGVGCSAAASGAGGAATGAAVQPASMPSPTSAMIHRLPAICVSFRLELSAAGGNFWGTASVSWVVVLLD